jgi:hypothetical protein
VPDGQQLVRRWFALALVVAIQGENAPAADLPRGGIRAVADQLPSSTPF